jgi:hypothetical protein
MDNHYKIEFKSKFEDQKYEYTFRTNLTGQDFLDLRQAQNVVGGSDVTSYLHANLVKRLAMWDRPEEVSDQAIKALPMDVYNVLWSGSLRLEGDELEEANSFLANLWGSSLPQELVSPSIGSSSSDQDGSELPSK